MGIPMTDLTAMEPSIKKEVDEAIQKVVQSGRFILGPEVEGLEAEIAAYCGSRFAVGVASGTDALLLALIACGIGPGDEVITTPFTFIATAEAITHCGARPVFVDIDPLSYNIDVNQIEKKISSRTRAVLPVHLFGQPAEMDAILRFKERYNLKVVEDCAQALSASYKGKKVGSLGDCGCFSFFPSKNLGAYGDAGMVVTDSSDVADKLKLLRQHGTETTYVHALPGFNSRLDAIQAAILRVKLRYLDRWSSSRRQIASLYSELLANLGGFITPHQEDNLISSTNYYTVRIIARDIDRNKLRNYLNSKGIATAVYYPLSLHLQKAYQFLGHKPGDFKESELAQEQVLSLPMYPEITPLQVREVVQNIQEFCARR